MISDFFIQNFVKDMNFTIKNMVKRSPVLDKTNMATLGVSMRFYVFVYTSKYYTYIYIHI
jgi:hypothetical protein